MLPTRLQIWVFAIVALLLSCSSNSKKETLRVATAANLRFAMEEINTAFEKQTGIKVEMMAASSGKLTAQIKNGAPYDIFLSANFKYPNTLYKESFAKTAPIKLCTGHLVIWTNKSIILDSTLQFLKKDEIQKIGIANPQNAPYGTAAEELLKNLHLYDSIKPKLIFAENISQLNQYVLNKAVDVGITSKSTVLSPKLRNTGKWKELDTQFHSPVKQFAVELKTSVQSSSNKKYLGFLMGKEAVEIFMEYGYSVNK